MAEDYKTKVVYTKDDLKKLNTYVLRTIPSAEKYIGLRKFVNDEGRTNLSNVIKRPVIPSYLKDKYNQSNQKPDNAGISRGNYRDHREMSRRKLFIHKTDNVVDKVNDEIRELLSKLSEGNKTKLLNDFLKYEISDECGQTLIDNIYTFAVDLTYLVHIYVELIFLLKQKNETLYNQLIDKIIQTAYEPIIFKDEIEGPLKSKRWRVANIKLISEIYCKDSNEIDSKTLQDLIDFLQQKINPQQPDNLEVLCELLKKTLPFLMKEERDYVDQIIDSIEPLEHNHDYDQRYRFMIQDIIEIYNYDEDE